MFDVVLARLKQGHRTSRYPEEAPVLPQRYRGCPSLDPSRCSDGCRACADACPTDALSVRKGEVVLDLGKCLFCTQCEEACPEHAITASSIFQLSACRREDLIHAGPARPRVPEAVEAIRRLFGRSLRLRQVSAAGCNACEADLNVLSTLVFDLSRFGIEFVASPRHADGIVVTGPVSQNMELALRKTYEAVPSPRIVIAVGACAISGGPFHGHAEVCDGVPSTIPVDLYVPGCPPNPYTILDGLLGVLGRLHKRS